MSIRSLVTEIPAFPGICNWPREQQGSLDWLYVEDWLQSVLCLEIIWMADCSSQVRKLRGAVCSLWAGIVSCEVERETLRMRRRWYITGVKSRSVSWMKPWPEKELWREIPRCLSWIIGLTAVVFNALDVLHACKIREVRKIWMVLNRFHSRNTVTCFRQEN